MPRIFITGSTDGLGLMAAELLLKDGHQVTVHARNQARAAQVRTRLPGADAVVIGDLSAIEDVRGVAEQVNALGRYDAVIHNAGVGYREPRRIQTADGLSHVFAINVLAPYLLTALITRPQRLVYLSSGMHTGGDAALDDPQWEKRRWNGAQAYADSKLDDLLLAFAVARRWSGVRSNAVEPGWVPTKMGGLGAPDDLSLAPVTQAWLAAGDDPRTDVTGEYFYHQKARRTHPAAHDPRRQDALLDYCAVLTSTPLPDP
jgi:NAD(P)-dependent dehydrogenase (short-subunit alcohol dehydrogenase family)